MRFVALCFALCAVLPGARAEEVTVAVASNFAPAMKALVALYSQRSGKQVRISTGATGKLYAQIINGAPFDLFLAADTQRPQRLERDGLIVEGSRYTYARGRLVLWSGAESPADAERWLRDARFHHLAVANARTAPYGEAAEQVLRNLGLYERLKPRLVYGENIAQTYQFVAGAAAEAGFVSLSQLVASQKENDSKTFWTVPETLYQPIEQQAVLLNDRPAARRFYAFLKSDRARGMIEQYGYRVPEPGGLP